MKRLLILVAVVLASVLAWLVWQQSDSQPKVAAPAESLTKHEALKGSQERLVNVKEVGGQPVATVIVNGRPTKVMAGELLVKTDTPDSLAAIGPTEETGLPSIYKLKLPAGADLAAETERVKRQPGVTGANPNYVVTAAATPNDPLYGSQYAPGKMGLPESWDRTTGSSSVMIASLDTGVNWNHQDLSGRNWINTNEIPGNDLDDDTNGYVDDYQGMDFVHATFSGGKFHNDADGPMDDHGHGSLTTGVFGANTNNGVGVAGATWQGKYVPVKVLDANGNGSFSDVAAGIRYAQTVGAKVMNLSLGALGVTGDVATDSAINDAYAANYVIAAASGNDGNPNVLDYPAYNPKTIAVGSTTSGDARSGFSNGGPQLDIVAPGSGIVTVMGVSNGTPVNNQYASFSGTSLSTPQVAAAAALLLAVNDDVSAGSVADTLKNSAAKVAGMGGQNWTNLYGYGRLNVLGALNQLNSSQWAGQSSYPTLSSGEQATVYIDYQNTGLNDWSATGPNPTRLGTSHALGRPSAVSSSSWISPGRATTITGRVESNGSVTPATTIAPGETARFEFTVTAPPVNGTTTYREYFQPLVEGINWMPDQGVFIDVTVQPKTYSYAWAGQTYPPAVMAPGETKPVTLNLTNTGTATWRKDTLQPFNVGTARPRDRASGFANGTWQSGNRLSQFEGTVSGGVVTPSDTVAPGQTARFNFDFVAPSQPGTYREYVEPLVDGFRWLGDIGMFWEVTVPSQDYAYQWVTQSGYPTVKQGESTTVKLQLRNTGRQTWYSDGATPVRLGTERPKDRQSGFSNNGTADGWISPGRVKLTRNLTDPAKDVGGETSIAPGEVAEFEFEAYGAAQPGSYNEFFAPVVEGVQWMSDIGIFWTMSVEKPIQVGLAQQATFTGTSDGPVSFIKTDGTVLATVPAGTPVTDTWNGSAYFGIWPGGAVSDPDPITVKQSSIHNILTVQNMGDNGGFNRFRGDLTVKNGAPGSWLINKINLEEYLRGLGEVPDSWPAEAIKAQTVAARTYAARRIDNPQNGLFDIYDTTQDQVYNGYNNEIAKPNHVNAIVATKGVVIKQGGQLIQAYYSSDSGGATGNNEDIWGGSPIPYLRGVTDPYERPDVWSKTVSNATIQSAYGHSGNVDTINITEYYASGRPKTIQLVTSGGATTNHTLPADTHRTKLTLRSSRITGLGRSGNDWVINGRGFGHGIGLGQWGAYNQANAGRGYGQILQFYYSGVSLENLY